MNSLSHNDICQMLISASDQVALHKEEINKANVFPVPDSDTGSNLTNTLHAIKKAALKNNNNKDIISELLHSALVAAQGNSGILFSAFLKGLLLHVKHREEISLEELKVAIERGYESGRSSIQNPLKGTMIDLMEGLHYSFQEEKNKKNIHEAFERSLIVLRKKVYETEDKMQLLKDNLVVDAGAIGFYYIIKGFCLALGTKDFEDKPFINERAFKRHEKDEIIDHVYEVVTILHDATMNVKEMQEMLSSHGNCLDIIEIEKNVKIHIHTDTPGIITEMVSLFGEIDSIFTVDMRTNEHTNI